MRILLGKNMKLFNYKKIIITGTLILGLSISSLSFCGCSVKNKESTASIFAMDTYMTITAYGEKSQEAVNTATEEINRLEDLLSTNIETSEIAVINSENGGTVSKDTAYLLKKSLEFYEATDGAYDITVYPLVYEWGFTTGDYKVPTDERIAELLPLIGSDKLHVTYTDDLEETAIVSFDEADMMVDLGTIAKGYASEKVAEIFKEYGIEHGLINLGGNVQLVGTKTDGSDWNVAIQKPDKDAEDTEYIGILSASDCAVTTAGGYERYFEEDGTIYRHIFDPSTGCPTTSSLKSVSIVAKDGVTADGYDTALYVMDLDGAITFWEEHKDLFDVIIVAEDDTVYISENIAEAFTTDYNVEILK